MTLHKFRMVLALILISFYCLVSGIILLYPVFGPWNFDQPDVLKNYKTYVMIFAGSALPGIIASIITYYFTRHPDRAERNQITMRKPKD